MQERQVTVDGESRALPAPFLVAATQNPIEYEGTYPLPEAQLDRFLFRIDVGYPDEAGERAILRLGHRGVRAPSLDQIGRVADASDLDAAGGLIDATTVSDEVADYLAALVRKTRELPAVELGASPRAAVHLLAASRAAARLAGPRVRDARRRRGHGRAGDRSPPGPAPGGRARARHAAGCGGCGDRGGRGASVTPTPRAAALLALCAAAAILAGWRVAAVLAAAVVAATAVDALRARAAPGVEREVAPVIPRGVPSRLAVKVRADGPVRVRQALPADVTLEPQEGEGELAGELVARRRGRHVLPAVGVRATGPLGLGAWYHRLGGDAELLVYPDLVGARRLALAARRGRLPESGRRARGSFGLGTAFEAVREYAPDDDVRQINWRATARLGRPMSNQYRIDQDREVRCLLDAGRLSAAACGGGTLLDVALDGLIAVCATADALGDRSGALAFADRVLRDVAPARMGAEAVARSLFDVEPVDRDSDYELAFRSVAGGKRGFVLVLADLVDEAAARALIDAVPVLARRHEVCVASVRDDALDGLLARPPAELRDAYAMTVALEMRRVRALAARRVGAAGATVVEARPERFAGACVSAYARAKARGRA